MTPEKIEKADTEKNFSRKTVKFFSIRNMIRVLLIGIGFLVLGLVCSLLQVVTKYFYSSTLLPIAWQTWAPLMTTINSIGEIFWPSSSFWDWFGWVLIILSFAFLKLFSGGLFSIKYVIYLDVLFLGFFYVLIGQYSAGSQNNFFDNLETFMLFHGSGFKMFVGMLLTFNIIALFDKFFSGLISNGESSETEKAEFHSDCLK
jgi:hypothetical protein